MSSDKSIYNEYTDEWMTEEEYKRQSDAPYIKFIPMAEAWGVSKEDHIMDAANYQIGDVRHITVYGVHRNEPVIPKLEVDIDFVNKLEHLAKEIIGLDREDIVISRNATGHCVSIFSSHILTKATSIQSTDSLEVIVGILKTAKQDHLNSVLEEIRAFEKDLIKLQD